MATFYQNNRDKVLAATKAWKKAHPDAVSRHNTSDKAKISRKRSFRKSKYGLTLDEYDARLAAQNNICDLCKEPFGKNGSERPVLDHGHDTGKPRAFIHDRCNVGIGRFQDDAVKCRLAAEYLEKHHHPAGPAQPGKE